MEVKNFKIIGVINGLYEVEINGKYGLIKISALYLLAEKFHFVECLK